DRFDRVLDEDAGRSGVRSRRHPRVNRSAAICIWSGATSWLLAYASLALPVDYVAGSEFSNLAGMEYQPSASY
ncbi:MAG: hypothetical protein ACK5LJ_09840, partial [Paracoccus sp. (in: a-proteobacteria)]